MKTLLLTIKYFIFVLLIAVITSSCGYTEYNDLYQVKYQNHWLFLNENGQIVIKIPATKFDDVGNFIEGRGIITKKIKDLNYDVMGADLYYKLVHLAIIDSHNNIIKRFNKAALILDDDCESNASYIPEFYKGYARISFVRNQNVDKINRYSQVKTKDMYIDREGNFVPEYRIPTKIKKMLNDPMIARNRYEYNRDLIPTEMKCSNRVNSRCFAYVDKNSEIKIPPIWDSNFTGCGDWFARNPYFYNNRAIAYFPKGNSPYLNGFFMFLNTDGKPINNKEYKYVEPFYRKLTIVYLSNGERAYINTSGKIVWSDKLQK